MLPSDRDYVVIFVTWRYFYFLPKAIFRFSKMADQKHEKGTLCITWEFFEVKRNVFIDENVHFFTLTYFLVFSRWWTKNMKNGTF